MASTPPTTGWFGSVQDRPAPPPDDEIKAKIRAMVAAGKSDDEIRKALEPKPEEGIKQYAAGIGAEAKGQVHDVGQLVTHGAPNPAESMGGAVGSLAGGMIKQIPGVAKRLGTTNPMDIALEMFRHPPPGVSAIDPTGFSQAAGKDETASKRAGRATVLGLEMLLPSLLGARAARTASLARAAKAAEEASALGKMAPYGTKVNLTQSTLAQPTAAVELPAVKGVATVPPMGSQGITTSPWMRMSVPNTGPRRPPGGPPPPPPPPPPGGPGAGVVEPPLSIPGPSGRKAPPPGARLVKNPPNPIVEATRQAVEEAQATHGPGAVELPPDPRSPRVQPPVSHPSEAQVKALVKAAAERKAKEAAARAAQAAKKATSTTPPAGGGTGTSTVPSTVPSTIQRLEETLADQRGEIDLTGQKGIPPEGGGKLVPAGGEPRGTPTMPTAAEIAGGEADAFLSDWAKGGKLRAKLLNQKLTPEVRAALETKLGERPGELPELRKALGLSATLEKAAAPHPAPLGFQPTPTTSLSDMVAKYGKEGAARRAGMKVSELEARIEAGGDPGKLEQILRQREGAAEANRRLGTASPSTGRLPDAAVDRIRAAAAKETAAGGLTDKTRALADRIHAERPDEPKLYAGLDPGAIFRFAKRNPKKTIAAGGATGGILTDAYQDPNADEDTKNANLVMGALAGAGTGAFLSNPAGILKAYLHLRNQGWLSGGAIAKNLITAGAAPVQSAVENLTPGRGRFSAAKEMLRVPTNTREWWKGTLDAPAKFNPLVPGQSRTPQLSIGGFKPGRLKPSSIIGGIDQAATKALERSGMAKGDIERLLLTSHRNFTRGGFWRNFDVEPPTTAERARWAKHKVPHAMLDAALPFQRVPTNIITEGLAEAAHPFERAIAGKNPLTARTLYNVAKTGAAYKIGEKAKESPRNRFMALLALAAAGPGTLPATIAMVKGYGPQGQQMLGGMSPFPEIQPNKTLTGWPPSLVTAYKHLAENK